MEKQLALTFSPNNKHLLKSDYRHASFAIQLEIIPQSVSSPTTLYIHVEFGE